MKTEAELLGQAIGFLVVCSGCGREMGKVPDRRTAYCNAGSYIHECLKLGIENEN